jgi:hypothetical protein
MNFTLSWLMTLLAAFVAAAASHWLSSTIGVIFLPRTPPLVFHSLMASRAPSLVEVRGIGPGERREHGHLDLLGGGGAAEREGEHDEGHQRERKYTLHIFLLCTDAITMLSLIDMSSTVGPPDL